MYVSGRTARLFGTRRLCVKCAVLLFLGGPGIVAYTLTDTSPPRRPLAETHTALPLDHDVDARVARAIRTLLRQAGIEPSPSPQATIEGLFPDGPRSEAAEKRPGVEQPPTPPPAAAQRNPAGAAFPGTARRRARSGGGRGRRGERGNG